jgi:hypothetical protein
MLKCTPLKIKVYLGYKITRLYSLGALRHWLPVRALPPVHVTDTRSAICQTYVTTNYYDEHISEGKVYTIKTRIYIPLAII